MSQEKGALAEAIAKHGGAAVDALIPWLETEDPEIYQLVTYCLLHLKQGDFRPVGESAGLAAATPDGELRVWRKLKP